MTKQEQIEEIKQVLIKTCKRCRPFEEDYMQSNYAEALYNAGYRKGNKEKNCWKCIESKRVTSDDYAKLQELFADYQLASEKEIRAHEERTKAFERNMKSVLEIEKENVRKETTKEIFQRVINICIKEEDFQDGTVNTQLEPLYFGIMNGCAFVRGEVKELAKQYGVEVEE